MKKLDELNERLVKLQDQITELKKAHVAEIKALEDEVSITEEMIAMISAFLSESQNCFNTLCVAQTTGGVTSGDLKTFAQSAGLEIPPELAAMEEAQEETDAALLQTG